MAKWIMGLGLLIFLIGFIIWLLTGLGVPFGKLPGDVHVKGEKISFYFPIATSIIVSVILTILLNLLLLFFKKS